MCAVAADQAGRGRRVTCHNIRGAHELVLQDKLLHEPRQEFRWLFADDLSDEKKALKDPAARFQVLTSGCAMTKGLRQWSPMARDTARTPITRTPFQNRI